MNHALVIASIVTAAGYIGCALVAIPPRRWTIPVQRAAIVLAGATCALDLITHAWVAAGVFAILVVSAAFTLAAKRRTTQLRELLRRWDA